MLKLNTLRRVYDFYASDLSYDEFERLIKRDAPEVYDFYVRRMKQSQQIRNPFKRTLVFIWNLFIEFLERLTPLRRLFYSAALFFFIWGNFSEQWNYAALGFFMLNILLAFEVADKLTAKDELAVARDIQISLMPKEAPVNKHFDISCYYETAREVGGDYMDFIESGLDDKTTFIVIGDISGKGMGAALRMVQVQAVLKYLISNCSSPKAILGQLNKNIQNILRPDNFFTVSLISLDSSGQLLFSRAGHTPLIHYKCIENKTEAITPVGLGIGLRDNGMFDKVIEEVTLPFKSGDIFVFYTDGLIETMNPEKNLFGVEMLRRIIEKNPGKTASEIKDIILDSLANFRRSNIPEDDMTLLILKAK
ncbi:MAG: PP2C family protein-serine/threonine phosphatase [Bacillota bacterium]